MQKLHCQKLHCQLNSTAKRVGILMVLVTSLLATTSSFGHRPTYDDSFRFDDSNGGESVSMAMRSVLRHSEATGVATRCRRGEAAGYPCRRIDLQSFVPRADMGGQQAQLNDIWGWTDPQTGAEIAIVGLTDGTSFIDMSDAANPVFLGKLNTHRPSRGGNAWRDVKVYRDHAFIVADGLANRNHGLQVFDLRTLRNISSPPQVLAESAHYDGFGQAHNIAINEDSGYAYVVGSDQCSAGLLMINIARPQSPQFAGCFSRDGYTHDAQCVIYAGPDGRYSGKEICFAYNEDTMTVVDVTNKSNPVMVSRTGYTGSQYTHQGWLLDESQSILILNDEGDEQAGAPRTTSYVFDVNDLKRPRMTGRYRGPTQAIDHNLYTNDGYVFESNYRAGLRILSTENVSSGKLREVAYFDVIPNSNSAQFSGAWSSYIYFNSGNIPVTDIAGGLFVVRPDWTAIRATNRPPGLSIADVVVPESQRVARVTLRLSRASNEDVSVFLSTRPRSAKVGSDFRPKTTKVTISAGQTQRTVGIVVVNDNRAEPTEALAVRLFRVENASITDPIGIIRIRDDD